MGCVDTREVDGVAQVIGVSLDDAYDPAPNDDILSNADCFVNNLDDYCVDDLNDNAVDYSGAASSLSTDQ